VGKTISEIKCPQCGRETQYATGNCEWCGAPVFQQRQAVHQAAKALMPEVPDRRLLFGAFVDRIISWIFGLGTIACFLALAYGMGGRHSPPKWGPWILIALACGGVALFAIGGFFYGRFRRYCPCPVCGGVMLMQRAIPIVPWYAVTKYRNMLYNYIYRCPNCGHTLGITAS
jgi:predicted RNA-binding Zn-ribbon protein involved in translation (DUF1610 family)